MSPSRGAGHDRDQQILSRLSKIEHKVDSIEQTNAFALRADADRHFEQVLKIFGKSQRRAQVYLAANGSLSVQELADHLKMHRQHVGADLNYLGAEGLLELVDSDGRRDIWAKNPLDRSLRITPLICDEFSLQPNGLQATKKGKRARAKSTTSRKTSKKAK